MADATCSQVVLSEIEEIFGELCVITDQWFADVKGELTHIQDFMAQISPQMVELMHRNTRSHRDDIMILHGLPK